MSIVELLAEAILLVSVDRKDCEEESQDKTL